MLNENRHRQRGILHPGRPSPRVQPSHSGPPQVELVVVGRDLLRGKIADANGSALARYFTQRGATVRRMVIVGHDDVAISTALREAFDRNPNAVVTTGGLGPSAHDRTLAAVADALGRPLTPNTEARELVEISYQRLRKQRVLHKGGLTQAREKLIEFPVGTTPIPNTAGIAPGLAYRLPGGALLLCLPGLPAEMQAVLEAAQQHIKFAEPALQVARREIESPTADESALLPLLDRLSAEFPDVWIDSRPSRSRRHGAKIMISLEATSADETEANAEVEAVLQRLLALAAGNP